MSNLKTVKYASFADNNFHGTFPPITISCTVVYMPSSYLPEERLKSRIFPNISVPSALISNRSGICSILVGSLLTMLRQTVLARGGSDYVSEIIITPSKFENIHVATTRVPTFGRNLEEPIHAYRTLGPLASLNLQMNAPPPPPADIIYDQELLAILSDHSITHRFLQSWRTMGVKPDTHFIIIFSEPSRPRAYVSLDSPISKTSSPAPFSSWSSTNDENMRAWSAMVRTNRSSPHSQSIVSRAASPTSGMGTDFITPYHHRAMESIVSHLSHSTSGSSSLHSQNITSHTASSEPMTNITSNSDYLFTEPLSTTRPLSHLPYSPTHANIGSSSYSPTHANVGSSSDYSIGYSQPQHMDSWAASHEPGVRANVTSSDDQMSQPSNLRSHDIDTWAASGVRENVASSSDHQMNDVCNLVSRAFNITPAEMASAKCCLSKTLLTMVVNHRSMLQVLEKLGLGDKNRFVDATTVTLPDGQVLAIAEIVKSFGWSYDSFRHKCSWYGWAEEVATSFQWSAPVPG
jgi:hypothetical protein